MGDEAFSPALRPSADVGYVGGVTFTGPRDVSPSAVEEPEPTPAQADEPEAAPAARARDEGGAGFRLTQIVGRRGSGQVHVSHDRRASSYLMTGRATTRAMTKGAADERQFPQQPALGPLH